MTYNEAEWEAKIEAAAQAIIDGTGTEQDLEDVMVAQSEAFWEANPL